MMNHMPMHRAAGRGEAKPGTCILHIGMPKTGTTSIQESLFHGTQDPEFLYVDMGQGSMDANRALVTMFADDPLNHHINRQIGLRPERLHRDQRVLSKRLSRILREAKERSLTPIISAEYGWTMNSNELVRLRNFIEDSSLRTRIIVYLRHWKAQLESGFQQRVKINVDIGMFVRDVQEDLLEYRKRIETLDSVFGREQVEVCLYTKEALLDGCSVTDFCNRIGMNFDKSRIRRANDSLSMPAVKLLHTYRMLGPSSAPGRTNQFLESILLRRLLRLEGPPVRFHSSVVAPLIQKLSIHRDWIEQRVGHPFTEDILRNDEGDCLRDLDDMRRYDPGSLEWLASETGNSSIHDPRDVAEKMHRLKQRPDLQSASEAVRRALESRIGSLRGKFRSWT